jgi:hypothetical protein
MIGLGLGNAVCIMALHDRTFGFNPNSAHFCATSSTLAARQRNMAASSIEHPESIADLRSSMSISVQFAPSQTSITDPSRRPLKEGFDFYSPF